VNPGIAIIKPTDPSKVNVSSAQSPRYALLRAIPFSPFRSRKIFPIPVAEKMEIVIQTNAPDHANILMNPQKRERIQFFRIVLTKRN
jgi:hypothetical protein